MGAAAYLTRLPAVVFMSCNKRELVKNLRGWGAVVMGWAGRLAAVLREWGKPALAARRPGSHRGPPGFSSVSGDWEEGTVLKTKEAGSWSGSGSCRELPGLAVALLKVKERLIQWQRGSAVSRALNKENSTEHCCWNESGLIPQCIFSMLPEFIYFFGKPVESPKFVGKCVLYHIGLDCRCRDLQIGPHLAIRIQHVWNFFKNKQNKLRQNLSTIISNHFWCSATKLHTCKLSAVCSL